MSAKHRRSMEWIEAEFGPGSAELRPELVATREQRWEIAREIRRAAEPIEGSRRGRALRDRALLIELEDSTNGAAELLAECEVIGLEVLPP